MSSELKGGFLALRHGCSPVNLLHIFRTPFPKNTSAKYTLGKWDLYLSKN